MLRESKEVFNPDFYWKNKHNIDLEYEKIIYQHLCGTISKRKLKRLTYEHKFSSYEAWKLYIRKKYFNLDNLKDFYRYLNLKRRRKNNFKEFYALLIIPILVFILGELLFDFSFGFDKLNLGESIRSITLKISLSFELIHLIAIFIVTFLIVIIFILFVLLSIYKPISEYLKADEENYFFEDYMEIIKELLEERMNSDNIQDDILIDTVIKKKGSHKL